MSYSSLVGQHFGKLEVLSYAGTNSWGARLWKCSCACGGEITTTTTTLRQGNATSCGCVRREKLAMQSFHSLVGNRYGMLEVLERLPNRNGKVMYRCRCDCGQYADVRAEGLRRGTIRSCGCLDGRPGGTLRLEGKRFGRLVVNRYAYGDGQHGFWYCDCDCGTKNFLVMTNSLTSGNTQSCGCLQRERVKEANTMHGQAYTKLYRVWRNMKSRCGNPNGDPKEAYWSLDISYCAEWETFESFYAWAQSAGYEEGLSLDRRNPFRDYEPDNCRWILPWEQEENKRENYLKPAREALAYALHESCPSDYQDKLRPILLAFYDDSYFSKLFKTLSYDALDSTSMKMLEEFLDAYCTAIVLLNLIANLPAFTQNQDTIDRITAKAISNCDSLNTQFLANNWPLPAFQSKEG